ncbi:MAG: hypothetical protein ACI9IP_001653 [Arcticibacterium sp.]|jgi:hypothetical protein
MRLKLLFHKSLLVFLLLLSAVSIEAQVITLSSEKGQFIDDLEEVFAKGKNGIAIAEFDTFKAHFQQDLSELAKNDIIAASQKMASRRYQMPEYYQFIHTLNCIFDPLLFPSKKTDPLISSLRKLAEKHPMDTVLPILKRVKDLIESRILYTSNFNKLYALNGEFDFEFLDQKQDYFAPEIENPTAQKTSEEDFGLFDDLDKEEEIDPWDNPKLIVNNDAFFRLLPLPLISDFVIKFKDVDLIFVTESDSLTFSNTSGAADLVHNVWVGDTGTINWNMVNIPEAEATFTKYSFKLSNPYLKAEKVTFSYDTYLTEPVEGVFEFKAGTRPEGQLSKFPRFKSYENNAVFTHLNDNVTYKGGFSLVGERVFSSSLYHNVSTLEVNKGLSNSFKVEGSKIEFTDSLITSDFVSFTTKIQEDSIYHPAVRLKYNVETKLLDLFKQKNGGYRNSMYSDTFHEMDIRCDAMQWNINTGKMDFYIIAGKTEVPAIFESFNYYNNGRLRQLSNVAGFNPLIFLGNYVYKKGKNRFDLFEILNKIQKSPSQIRNGILVAHQMGFLDYEPHSDTYSLSRKGLHYFKAATRRGDYDDLVFASVSKGGNQNASIDRNSNALNIAGTQEFKLSDSLGIRFLPRNKSLKMEGSKSFKFEGEIVVKNYRIIGDFEVDYERFLVNLNRIDSITFTPIDIYKAGGRAAIGGHVAYGKTGMLFLNAPDNKSGRKYLPQYPRLLIPDGAVVHFSNPERGDFAYPEDDVFFTIDKIDHDSLNTIDMAYTGIFKSGGIFRPIKETLITMPDTSIGFVHQPRGLYELYETASVFKFDAPLKMTKKGLVSEGNLSHLATNLNAGKAEFAVDKMRMTGENGKVKETFVSSSVYFPDVAIANFNAIWIPKEDSLKIESTEAYSFYKESTTLKGSLVVRNSGLYGQGFLERNDSEAKSKTFKFNKAEFSSTDTEFIVKADSEGSKPVLKGEKVDIAFNVEEQIVNISPGESSFNDTIASSISFPNAAYKTTIDNAKWDIKKKTISMSGDVTKSRFSSTAKNQFGLAFNGTAALYNITANTLNINGVPGINSVDAIIVPYEGKVAVKGEGKLDPFQKATVIVDTLNKFHTLANANITISSKLSYTGDASYQFVNVRLDTFNIKMGGFEFAEITPEGEVLRSKKSGNLSTIAKAKVTEVDSVFLSPKMLYIGDITMKAPFKNLSLRGQVTPTLDKYPILGSNWINYSGNKSEEITINVDASLKDGGKDLFAGLHLKPSASSEGLYPTFLSAKGYEDDYDIFLANGILKRDEPNKRFTIYPTDSNAVANKYELYEEEGLIKLEGKLNLLRPDLASYVETVGLAEIDLDSLDYVFNTMMKFNMPIPIPMLLNMGDNIVKTNLDIGNSDGAIAFESPEFQSKMEQFVGKKVTDDYKKEYYKGHVPLFKASPKFFSSLLFSDLKLQWNPVFNAFHSTGALGISNIGETDINANIPGYFEIIKNPRTGDEIYIFLEVSQDTWYYIGYKSGQLGLISSDFEFNKILSEKEKTSKGIEIINVDLAEAMAYRKRFLMTYLGVKEEAFEKAKRPRATPSLPGQIQQVEIPSAAPSKDGEPTTPAKKKVEEEASDGF